MKTYTIKPEFLSAWGSETTENNIVTESEIQRLSNEWGVSVDNLMEQTTFCTDTRFEIKTDSFEFRFGKSKDSIPAMTADEVFDTYQMESANDPTLEASFDTLEEAQAEFSKNYSGYGTTYAEKGFTFWLLRGKVAWIEENEYDEDGEFDQGGCTYDFSAEAYEVEEDE